MATEPTPSPNGKQTTKLHTTNEATKINNTDENSAKVRSKLHSKQPRFTTTEIIQKFPNLNNRYCQKIGFSVPWDNEECPPNNDTYHHSVRQIFNLVKEYDPQFQLIPWNITNRNYNPIVNEKHIPTSSRELKEYIYDLHIQPKRVRAAMVVTSSYNLKEILKQQTMALKNSNTLLNKMRKAKIHMKPLSIQTLGEIKLIGFLQFIHPHFSNIKKLLIELQSILETKDITIEMYRPSAITKDNKIIDAPEALAIGAPSDISIAVYKSLIEKWDGIRNGDYDILIGEESLLKDGYFIPFSSNLLNRESRNQAVFSHKAFLQEYTCIHLKQCSSVDIQFTLTKTEADTMEYILGEEGQQIVTLRDLIQCWTEPKSDLLLVHTIQSMSGNKKTLLVKRKYKKYITKEILRVLDTLGKRQDFNKICGNSEELGAFIDKFTISKSGRSYLSKIRVSSQVQNPTSQDESITETKREKRKRHVVTDSSLASLESSTKSPTHKKGNHEDPSSPNDKNNTSSMTYSQATMQTSSKDNSDNKIESTAPNSSVTQLTVLKATNTSIESNVNSTIHERNNEDKSNGTSDNCRSSTSTNHHSTDLTVISQTERNGNNMLVPQPSSRGIVPFIDTSTAEVTPSTLTTDEHGRAISIQSTLITQIVDQQIYEFRTVMTEKYDKAIQSIQLSHANQISKLTNKQKQQDTDILNLRKLQTDTKNDMDKKIEDKVESQTQILNSLVTLIQDMKTDRDVSINRRKKKKAHSTNNKIPSPKVSQNDLTDCSYSECCSSQSSGDSEQNDSNHTDPSNMPPESNKLPETIVATPGQHNDTQQPLSQCKAHENNIIDSDETDIRKKTRSQISPPTEDSNDQWKGVTSKSKRATKLHLAIISPSKQKGRNVKYDKQSPNYNKFDPDGTITKKNLNDDHSNDHQRVLRSGRIV